ncbi:MAG: preprotein translocase subunit SecE [Patescibacteria group bacterium]|jgi:preprotein translocase subunit SecE
MSIITKIVDYFVSAKNELSKVSWPSRQETIRYSALVIVISVGVAVFFGVLDVGLSNVVTTALANKKVTTEQPGTTQVPVTPTVEGGQPAGNPETPTIKFDEATPITIPAPATTPAPDTKK